MEKIPYDNRSKRFMEILDRLDRHIPLKSPTGRCRKSIFVDRYFRFLNGKCFKLKIDGEIHYAAFYQTRHTTTFSEKHQGETWFSYGVQFTLGHSLSEFDINFKNEKFKEVQLQCVFINKIHEIEYEEITREEYFKIVKLFV